MPGMLCPSCNTPAPAGAIFCDFCGFDLRTVNSEALATQLAYMPASASNSPVCPMCGHPNVPGAAFCENCGAQLSSSVITPGGESPSAAPSLPAAPSLAAAPTPAGGFVTGRLVVNAGQAALEIPPGKTTVVLGREDPVSGVFPDIDLDPHGGHENGVGRRHAQLVWVNGQVCLEDLDSVNGTTLNHIRLAPHQPQPLSPGDEILLGKLALTYQA